MSKNHPLDLLGEKAMKKGIGQALESFSGVKISLAIVFHLECAELTKFQGFLKMVLRSKAQQESIIRSKRGNTVQESPSSTTSLGVGSEKKKRKISCLELMLQKKNFISACLQYNNYCVDLHWRQRKDKSSMMLT